ncbi:MAG: hypothetical protein U0992_20720 [Planctomycetaceae bacterium]
MMACKAAIKAGHRLSQEKSKVCWHSVTLVMTRFHCARASDGMKTLSRRTSINGGFSPTG